MRPFVPIVCAALSVSALFLAPRSQAASQAVLPKGTPVKLSLETNLRSGQERVGETVLFTVTQSIDGPNQTLLVARGAQAVGHVTQSTEKGAFGRRGKLIFTCDFVRGADGTQIPLHLVVEAGSGIGAAAEAAEETDALEYRAFSEPDFDPDGYVQSAESGGYYFQQKGLWTSRIYDPGRFFGGEDAVVKRGQKYKATVASDTPLDAVSY